MSEKVLGLWFKNRKLYEDTKSVFEDKVVPVVELSWLDSELAGWIRVIKENKLASPEVVASIERLCFKLYADACAKAEEKK